MAGYRSNHVIVGETMDGRPLWGGHAGHFVEELPPMGADLRSIACRAVQYHNGPPQVLSTAWAAAQVLDFETLKDRVLCNPGAWTIREDPYDDRWFLIEKVPQRGQEIDRLDPVAYGIPSNDLRCVMLECLWRGCKV